MNKIWGQISTGRMRSTIDWFGTTRARFGFLIRDDALVYGTVGYAYANRSHLFSDATFPFSREDSDIDGGFVVGGGVELLRHDRWLLRAEGLYIDLGKESRTYTAVGCGLICTAQVDWEDTFWVARLGLSVKLGHRAEQLEPLK